MKWVCNAFCVLLSLLIVVLGYEMFDKSPAIDYGRAGQTFLKLRQNDPKPLIPIEVTRDKTINVQGLPAHPLWVCVYDATWERTMQSVLTVWFYGPDGKRLDYDPILTEHKIPLPPKLGKLEPKCRATWIPTGLPEGKIRMSGEVTSTDTFLGNTRVATTKFPDIDFFMAK